MDYDDIKVGERLVVTQKFGACDVGATGTVENKDPYQRWVYIKWVENSLRHDQSHGWYYPSYFERPEEQDGRGVASPHPLPAEYIISVKKHGFYEPAAKPKVYVSDKQAHTVAKRMAQNFGGQFVVFKAISSVEMPAPAEPQVTKFA